MQTRATYGQELLIALAGLWFTGGLFLDGWAHNHIPELETFFTPWHAAFYSGALALTLCLLGITAAKRRGKGSWRDAVPEGYGWALLGVPVFFAGGVGDMLWHLTFGIEANVDALLSPTHLLLATGGVMMASGALLSWWHDPKRAATAAGQLPLLVSSLSTLSLLTFMVQYSSFVDLVPAGAYPSAEGYDAAYQLQARALSGYLVHTAFMAGVLLLLVARGRLAPGFVTLLLAANVAAMATMREGTAIIPAAVVAALVSDLFLQLLYRRGPTIGWLRFYAFWTPFSLMLLYMGTLLLTGEVWWTIHAWTGSAVMAGFAGLLVSLLVWPPASADRPHSFPR